MVWEGEGSYEFIRFGNYMRAKKSAMIAMNKPVMVAVKLLLELHRSLSQQTLAKTELASTYEHKTRDESTSDRW